MSRKGRWTSVHSCKGHSDGQESLLFLCSLRRDDKNVISLTELAQRFVGPLLKVFRKEVISCRRDRRSHSHATSLLVKLPTNGEVCGSEVLCSTGPEEGLTYLLEIYVGTDDRQCRYIWGRFSFVCRTKQGRETRAVWVISWYHRKFDAIDAVSYKPMSL